MTHYGEEVHSELSGVHLDFADRLRRVRVEPDVVSVGTLLKHTGEQKQRQIRQNSIHSCIIQYALCPYNVNCLEYIRNVFIR